MSLTAMCEIHHTQMYEKEGQYGPFWSHKTEDPAYESQKGYCNGKVAKVSGYQAAREIANSLAHRAPEQTREPVKEDKPDWDEIAKGKVRHGVAVAFIEQGMLLDDSKQLINDWVEFIITGE